jgi:predicted DNA binding protein
MDWVNMNGGVLAKVAVADPECCPVSSLSEGTRITSVSQGRPMDGQVPVEVTTDDRFDDSVEARRVFSNESETVYRTTREADLNCACERIQQLGCPVRDVRAADGTLVLSFIAPNLEGLRSVVSSLRTTADSVRIRCLKHSDDALADADPILLDRSSFTDRQREVLETAHRMGYFEHPKRANGSEVADELGIAQATFAEHLGAAQQKLMDALLADEPNGRSDA